MRMIMLMLSLQSEKGVRSQIELPIVRSWNASMQAASQPGTQGSADRVICYVCCECVDGNGTPSDG